MKFHIFAIVAVLAIASAQDVPDCRATFIDANGNATLINRNDEGDMGCISDEECIQYTAADSWCKDDGTCHGCEDWTGCCDLGNDPPAAPVECIPTDIIVTEPVQDLACTVFTGCSNSYCQDDSQICFPCDPTPENPPPAEEDIVGFCFGVGFGEDMAKADALETCKLDTQCPESQCLALGENENFIGESGLNIVTGLCLDGCNETFPGYDHVPGTFCLIFNETADPDGSLALSSDIDCAFQTDCSSSFCKPLNNNDFDITEFIEDDNDLIVGVGTCHQCPADGAAENPVYPCGSEGDEALDNEICRWATGCSRSYCKSNNVCYSCEDDGASTPEFACGMFEDPTVADAFCKTDMATNCRESYCKENGFCKGCNQEPTGDEPLPCAYEVDFEEVGDWDDWCSSVCDLEISFSVCQPNNLCSPCQPSPVFAGDARIENPEDPECRQGFLFGPEDEFHLITRNGEGVMGCVSDQECIDNTSAGSWCKPDGTCAGCEDWEGCCVKDFVVDPFVVPI